MDTQQYDIRKYAVRIGLVLAALLVAFVLYDNLAFRLKSTSPSLSNVADSSTEIRLYFSQPVKSIGKVTFNEATITPRVNGKEVIVSFDRTLIKNADYSLVVKDVTSEWFDMKIQSIERSFTPKYVPYDKLPAEQKKVQVDNSNSGQVDDSFISKNAFPVFNERWQIDAVVDTTVRTAILNVKFFEEIPNYDQGGVVTRVSNETAETYRREVLQKITDDGGDPANYTIVFDNPYLYEKYNQGDAR
ncbi:MAG: hypothetical protein WBK76_05735 [Candidatus Saccharimonadales bacterium]